jgi:hypothetical protein
MKKGAGNPRKNKPESFDTAIPSTLLPAKDTTSNASTNPSNEVIREIMMILINEISLCPKKCNAAIDTKNAINVGSPSLEIKYPSFPKGVTTRYLDIPSSISPRITYAAAKQYKSGVMEAKSRSKSR